MRSTMDTFLIVFRRLAFSSSTLFIATSFIQNILTWPEKRINDSESLPFLWINWIILSWDVLAALEKLGWDKILDKTRLDCSLHENERLINHFANWWLCEWVLISDAEFRVCQQVKIIFHMSVCLSGLLRFEHLYGKSKLFDVCH